MLGTGGWVHVYRAGGLKVEIAVPINFLEESGFTVAQLDDGKDVLTAIKEHYGATEVSGQSWRRRVLVFVSDAHPDETVEWALVPILPLVKRLTHDLTTRREGVTLFQMMLEGALE